MMRTTSAHHHHATPGGAGTVVNIVPPSPSSLRAAAHASSSSLVLGALQPASSHGVGSGVQCSAGRVATAIAFLTVVGIVFYLVQSATQSYASSQIKLAERREGGPRPSLVLPPPTGTSQAPNTKTIGMAVVLPSIVPGAVLTLTPDDFPQFVERSEKHVFVKFYSPTCSHCIRFAPTWVRVAKAIADTHPDVVIAEVDAVQYRDFAAAQGVRAYPTLIFYHRVASGNQGATVEASATATALRKTMFAGARDDATIIKFIEDQKLK